MTTEIAERPLLEWMREQDFEPLKRKMSYGNAAVSQMIFFRDKIGPMFLHRDTPTEEFNALTTIAGFHHSKSIDLPVYHLIRPFIEVHARDNFYNWNVTIRAKKRWKFPPISISTVPQTICTWKA
jgi:hypothetical protein